MTNYMDPNSISVKSDFEAFVSISRHLLTQKEKCIDAYGDCAYRGSDDLTEYSPDDPEFYDEMDVVPNSNSCAVGILIKDQFYSSELESNDVYAQIIQEAVKDSHSDWIWGERTLELLKLMQMIHDQVKSELWPLYFVELCEYFVTGIGIDPAYHFDGDLDDLHSLVFHTFGIEYNPGSSYGYNHSKIADKVSRDMFNQYSEKFEELISSLGAK